jgi:acetolactate synthase-1/2/3 large subunit
MKLSDYIARYISERGITRVFSVTGGFAMHLNDSFSKTHTVVYQHGEQPCAYTAMGYSRMNLQPSVVCTTAGCGATNAVTPCLIAYQDSVPVFFISGAVPHKDNVRYLKHSVRTYTGSDCDIISMVEHITKYAVELWDPSMLRYELDMCIHHLTTGVPGPVWLSIPLDIQSLDVHDDDQLSTPVPDIIRFAQNPPVPWTDSKRPVLLVGNGIRLSRTLDKLERFVHEHKIPVVSTFFGTDLVPEYNLGRVGIIGDRTGNFTIQNADLVICLGARLAKTVVGYRPEWFANGAQVCMISNLDAFFDTSFDVIDRSEWLNSVRMWNGLWFRELPNPDSDMCPYTFMNTFYTKKPAGETTVVSSGSIACVAWHQCVVKPGDRYIMSSHGDMGYELPVSIGCAFASGGPVWVVHGDGSFQFNFQELDTIQRYNLPVKILVFNNGGYGAIQITQDAYFKHRTGVDFQCPSIQKIADVYGIPYFTKYQLDEAIACTGPCVVEIVCHVQERYPKLQNIMRDDGTFENRPFEDMYPSIDYEKFMIGPTIH